MTEEFIAALNDYCQDHFDHFGGYPMDFEFKGVVYEFKDFVQYIK